MNQERPDNQPPPYPAGFSEREGELDVRGMHDVILREKDEPRDGYEPIPVTLIFIYFGIVLWIGVYLGLYSGNFDPQQYDHRPGASVVVQQGERQEEKLDPLALGKRLYMNCITCHQADGKGVAGAYPPLDGSRWVTGPPETPVRILLHGLSGPITVAGEEYNDNMPAFGERLTDEQIAAVLSHVRQAWSNEAPPIDPPLVTALRNQHGDRQPWSADELTTLEGEPIPGLEALRSEAEQSEESADEESGPSDAGAGS